MKKVIILIFVLLLGALYLNRAYARIYTTIENGGFTYHTDTEPIVVSVGSIRPADSIINYVVLGDSLSAGAGVNAFTETYQYTLGVMLSGTFGADVQEFNLAQLGARTSDILLTQLPKVAGIKPDIITLVIGVNDIHFGGTRSAFAQDLNAVVDALVKTGARVYVSTIPYIGGKQIMWPPYQQYFDWQTRRYNTTLLNVLKDKKITVVDLYSKTHEQARNGTTYYSSDNFHLGAAGYNTWATIFYDAIYR